MEFRIWADEIEQLPSAQRRGITTTGLRKLPLIEGFTWAWLVRVESAIEQGRDLKNCKLLVYENLCLDPINGSKELFSWADLNWQDQTEDFLIKSVSYKGAKPRYHQVVRNPVEAAFKWRQQLSDNEIKSVTSILDQSDLASVFPDRPG